MFHELRMLQLSKHSCKELPIRCLKVCYGFWNWRMNQFQSIVKLPSVIRVPQCHWEVSVHLASFILIASLSSLRIHMFYKFGIIFYYLFEYSFFIIQILGLQYVRSGYDYVFKYIFYFPLSLSADLWIIILGSSYCWQTCSLVLCNLLFNTFLVGRKWGCKTDQENNRRKRKYDNFLVSLSLWFYSFTLWILFGHPVKIFTRHWELWHYKTDVKTRNMEGEFGLFTCKCQSPSLNVLCLIMQSTVLEVTGRHKTHSDALEGWAQL